MADLETDADTIAETNSKDSQPVYIVDSFAILALLGGEAGAQRVQDLLDQAKNDLIVVKMSAINLGEVLYITERERSLSKAQAVLAIVDQLPLEILDATHERILAAAHIKANYPVAYADAFAIGAAQEFQAIAVTGDPEFKSVADLIQIEWLTQKN